ncbi:MAG: choice-of-anchor Q domain-containing protein [Rhodothermales bacterium]
MIKPIHTAFHRTITCVRSCMFVLLIWISPLGVFAQTTHTVTNTDDAGPGSLRQTVADAEPGDSIIFDQQLIGQTLSLSSGQINIDKNLTITGPGADAFIISGSNLFRIFEILSDITATLSELTLTEGSGELNGGGISVGQRASLSVDQVIIRGNTATDNGGGIYNGPVASTTITNSVITENTALGELSPNGGAVYNAGGFVHIENSELTQNQSLRGGGIWNAGGSTMTINSSLIKDNTATIDGGGIYNNNKLTITSSTITGNQADSEAGGLKNRGSDTLAIINSTVSENQSGRAGGIQNTTFGTIVIQNTTVYGNRSSLPGAGIITEETTQTLIYSSIIALNVENNSTQSDLLDLGFISSQGFNFIGNGDASRSVENSRRFERRVTDFVGSDVFSLDPGLSSLTDFGGLTQAHAPLAHSPIIDNGDCSMSGLMFDQRGEPRVVDVPGIGFSNPGDGCDIGAIEASASLALPDEDEAIPQSNTLEPAFPNPFQHQTTFKIALEREQEVTITLHNVTGQLVRTIHAGFLLPNRAYSFDINAGSLASGIYMYKVSGKYFEESRPVLLLK